MTKETKTVYTLIAAVMKDLAENGISKEHKNQQQGYKFRGIDDVYNSLSPIMSKHGLVILPRVLTRECVERTTKSGGALFYSFVEVEYDFVSASDGSTHTVKTFGEAMDSADKSTNKAMSAAYKYACIQAFCIPTEGDNDADGQTHDVAGKKAEKKPEPKPEATPEELAMRQRSVEISNALKGATTIKMLEITWQVNEKEIKTFPEKWQDGLKKIHAEKAAQLDVTAAG